MCLLVAGDKDKQGVAVKTEHMRRLERLQQDARWQEAIRLTKKLIAENPEDHWLVTRQSSHYYEIQNYRMALRLAEKALKQAPYCPLVLWDYAGALRMLDRPVEARAVYRRLLRRGVDRIANGPCGEGKRSAEVLLNDCRHGMAMCYWSEGRLGMAERYFRAHLVYRKPGLPSLYWARDVKRWIRELGAEPAESGAT